MQTSVWSNGIFFLPLVPHARCTPCHSRRIPHCILKQRVDFVPGSLLKRLVYLVENLRRLSGQTEKKEVVSPDYFVCCSSADIALCTFSFNVVLGGRQGATSLDRFWLSIPGSLPRRDHSVPFSNNFSCALLLLHRCPRCAKCCPSLVPRAGSD